MQSDKFVLQVCNPRGYIRNTTQVSSQDRLANLSGTKLGILNNGKPGGQMLLPYLQSSLEKRLDHIEFRQWKVPFAEAMADKEPKLKEMAVWADAIIALMGD